MTDSSAFTKLVPGFDFLQSLVKNAGAALPGIGQWVAPTIDPAELEKRIEELRTVQFWLEQNARMLGATIQALEVQRMTLSTLKTMNVQMEDLRDSLQIRMPTAAPTAPATPEPAKPRAQETAQKLEEEPGEAAAASAAADESAASATPKAKSKADNAQKPAANGAAGVVDPLQWWGALTKQFAELATTAMKDTSTDAARSMAGEMIKKSIDTASQSFAKAAAVMPKPATKPAASKSTKPAAKARPATKAAGKRAASTSGQNKKGSSSRKGVAGQ